MGRGLGVAQLAMLDALPSTGWITSADLAVAVGRSAVQVRAAVSTLESRGHVVVRRACIGRRSDGLPIYGRIIRRRPLRGRLIEVDAREAVAFVQRWHYSATASSGTLRFGWEIDGELVGVSILSNGTHAMRQGVFGPDHYQHVLHHHRLAMTDDAPQFSESQFIGATLRWIRAHRPDVWAVVTYADECQGHRGTIYQATNAQYTGLVGRGNLEFRDAQHASRPTRSISGTWPERRARAAQLGWREGRCLGKHRYVYTIGTKVQRAQRPPIKWPTLPHPRSALGAAVHAASAPLTP